MANRLVALRLDPVLNEQLERYAHLLERSKTWIIRKGLENILEEMEDAEIALQRLNDPNAEYISLDELKKELDID